MCAPATWHERYATDICPPTHDELKDRDRVGNTLITLEGQPGFVDWQGPHPSSLSIPDRRRHERGLLQHYLDTLAKAGGPRFALEDVWERHAAAIKAHESLELIEPQPEYKRQEQK
ncbi:uncharacterized protein BCR38DRAFT_486072 [Pseudomassariella vexata]|uniref:Uncharacterized protein n=1 Tax=Pseudomassariella vexata TaxID=1141098 RepID=A0A1Y2DVW8_9PEZI|nr:uncharacterized protein BCR38DRAFT_486072 [Pseudomassariella vexata]ORY63329.1 hypothetical protein BCR38DRAFT_486072 [Pseudomassariella vexata]